MDMSRSRRQGPYTARATESSIIRTIVPSSAQGTVQESPQWMVIREENRRRWKNSPSMAPRSPPAAAYAAASAAIEQKSGRVLRPKAPHVAYRPVVAAGLRENLFITLKIVIRAISTRKPQTKSRKQYQAPWALALLMRSSEKVYCVPTS